MHKIWHFYLSYCIYSQLAHLYFHCPDCSHAGLPFTPFIYVFKKYRLNLHFFRACATINLLSVGKSRIFGEGNSGYD